MKSFPPWLSGLVYAALITVVATVFMLMASFCVACTPSTTEKKAAAEGAYGASLARCVDESSTREEADACARKTREAWSLDAGRKGGGQ